MKTPMFDLYKMKGLTCFFLGVLLCSPVYGQDSLDTPEKWNVSGYLKTLQNLTFDKDFINLISGNTIHNRLNFKWKPTTRFTSVAEIRTRLFWGEEVKLTPGFASFLRNQNEQVNMQKAWIDNESVVLHSNVERLYLDFQTKALNVRLGRQRVNWGINTTWNPNDIFNAYNFLDFDYEERPGIDGGKVHYIINDASNAEFAFAFIGNEETVGALKYSLNKLNYDIQLIAGWYKDHTTTGLGWAGYIYDAGFKGEVQYYFQAKRSDAHLNLAIEGDYMLENGWYLNAGILFNNKGRSGPITDWNMLDLNLSPENLMPTKWNYLATTSKEITPLLSGTMSVLYAPGTRLLILLPSVQFNIAPEIDVNILGQSFLARFNTFEAVNHRLYLRIKWSF